jgi:hypothetical protein
MENLTKASPAIFLDIGGSERRFGFTMKSMGRIIALTGKNPMKGELDGNDPADLAILVWAGLITFDKSLDGTVIKSPEKGQPGKGDENVLKSIELVEEWMSFDRLPEISEAVSLAFQAANPSESKKKKLP